jgi:hypothetical protein
MWTKLHAADRIVAHTDGFGACHTAASAGGFAPPVDRVVGEALQMDGGHLTGTLKLLNVVSDRRSPAGLVRRQQLASGYTIQEGHDVVVDPGHGRGSRPSRRGRSDAMEPDAQNARLETPVSGSDPDPGTPPGEVSAALRVQILSTEHWSLLATRSQTWSESFARAQMFLSVLSANVIALALVAQTSLFGAGFTAFALVLLPVVLFVGLATYVRLVSVNHDEHRWVRGMNRIRAGYLELAPELERYFVTSHHDDERGILATAGWKSGPTLFGYVTTPAVVGVIDAVLAGVITFIGASALGLEDRFAAVLGVVVAVGSNLGLSLYAARASRREFERHPAISPSPEAH